MFAGFVQLCGQTVNVVRPNLATYGNYLDDSDDARRLILEGDGTSDMTDGVANIRCKAFKNTAAVATSSTVSYIMAVLDSGYVKMVMLQVRGCLLNRMIYLPFSALAYNKIYCSRLL